jgi:hypothetical protein
MKDAYYFPHDCNAIDDPKIMIMIADMGLESYAIYWILIEHLRQQPDFRSDISILKPLANRHGSTEAKFKTVVFTYDLFQIDNDVFFYSQSLINRMQPYLEKSERARVAARKRWDNANACANALPEHSGRNASKVKESKVNKNIPTFDEFYIYANSKKPNISKEHLRLKYEAWTTDNWHTNGNGTRRKIKNWKTTLLNTIPYIPIQKKHERTY